MKKRQLLITCTRRSVSFYLGTEGNGYTVAKVTAALLGKGRVRRRLKQYDNLVLVERETLWSINKGCVRTAADLKYKGPGYASTCLTCRRVREQVHVILRKRDVRRKPIVL